MLFCCMRLAGDLEAAVRGGAREVAAGGGGQEPPGGGEQAEGGGGAGGGGKGVAMRGRERPKY